MSNKTFIMSSNQAESAVSLSHRGLQFILSPEGHYSNSSMPMSPDSNSSNSNMSDTEDINKVETSLYEATSSLYDVPYDATMNLNQTFNATPVNDGIEFWNETLNIACNEDSASKNFQTLCMYAEDEDYRAGTSPDVRKDDSHLSLCETSSRGSAENDSCSLSSGEMVNRSNSVYLVENRSATVSSLDESPFSAPGDSKALSSECNLLKVVPDVCETSSEEVKADGTAHPGLGVTFTWELPTDKSDVAKSSSSCIALPSENERGHLMTTFICETSSDCGEKMMSHISDAEPFSCYKEAITPGPRKSFVSTQSAMQESDKDIQTSTPVQSIENQTLRLPLFSVSRIGSESSPGCSSVKQPKTSATHKQSVVGLSLTPTASRNKKMDIKTFPKTDFSNVKSKVMTRAYNYRAASGHGSQYRQTHVDVNSKYSETHKLTAAKMSPIKPKSNSAVGAAASRMVKDSQRRMPTELSNRLATVKPTGAQPVVPEQSKSIESPSNHLAAASGPTSGNQFATSNTEQEISSQDAGNQMSLKESPGRCGQRAAAAPKVVTSNKLEVGPGSVIGQNKTPIKTQLRSSSVSSSSASQSPKERKTIRFSSFRIPKVDTPCIQTKAVLDASHRKQARRPNESDVLHDEREVKKISLVAQARKCATASGEESKGRFQVCPSPRQTRGSLLHQGSTATLKATGLSARLRLETLGKFEFRTSKGGATPQSKQKSTTGHQRTPSEKQVLGNPLTPRVKLQLNKSRPPQTPGRPVLNGPPSTPSFRLSRKILGASKVPTEANELAQSNENIKVSGGGTPKPPPLKSVFFKARIISTTGPNNGAVDKNISKARSEQQPLQQQTPRPKKNNGPSISETDRRDDVIQHLEGLLAASNRRFEAVAIVLQQSLIERDEAASQCSKLSQELVDLKGELVCSTHSSQHLEKEKEELRVALDDALHSLQVKHQRELTQLEQRLQTFYQDEWDKMHLSYQEEADRCRTLMQQQMLEFKNSHEVMKLELENSFEEQLQSVIGQYEKSLEELRRVHDEELQSLDKTLKEAEANVSGRIKELTEENNYLIEKLTAEENRRKEAAEKSEKDLHTLYLEQELESLKVVLDIKTKQLHQQEKKLMEIDKLMEKNMKLDENLRRLQQENEDFKARMERHSALSRQLSSEQAMLQETLQKESKVNKRLSMENEELLWKLHNGDLSSPRKVSPTSSSPSHSFNLQAPPSSGFFSSPPVSPR